MAAIHQYIALVLFDFVYPTQVIGVDVEDKENYFDNLIETGDSVSGWFVLWRKVLSHTTRIKLFYTSSFPYKHVNFFFISVKVKDS